MCLRGAGAPVSVSRPDAKRPQLTPAQQRRPLPDPDGSRSDLVALGLKRLVFVFFLEEARVEGSLYM